jgi:hypothetical protein
METLVFFQLDLLLGHRVVIDYLTHHVPLILNLALDDFVKGEALVLLTPAGCFTGTP